MKRAFALTILVAGLALGPEARANEPDAYGLGSRATAMGGAVAADAADFSGNYYNPAALVGAPGLSLSLGYTYAFNNLRINDRDSGVANVHGLVGGLVAPGKIFGVPFALGVGTYMPDAGLSRIKALRQETPRWALYDERASIIFLAVSLAFRPVSWLELGGGLAFLAATRGRFGISGTARVLNPYESELRHEVDADLTSIRYPQIGARIKLGDIGYLGLVYRGETKLKLALDAHLNGQIDFAGVLVPLLYDLESRTIDAFLPQQFVWGLSIQRIPRLKVNLDFTFVNWAAYESPTAQTKAHLEATLPPGTAFDLPADPKPVVVLPPAFQNRLVPRIGLEYALPLSRGVEMPLRAGYVYERSPVPPQTGLTNFVDTDRHTLSLGAGLVLSALEPVLPGSLTLDLHAQLSLLPERLTLKASPADFVGDYRASGTMFGLGTTLSLGF